MTRRMLNREEISLTERNVKRHKRDVKILNYRISQRERKLLNWESIIKPKLEQDIIEKKSKYEKELEELKAKDTAYDNFRAEQTQYILDNWEIEELDLKQQIKGIKGNLQEEIKQYKTLLSQIEEVIRVSEDQIKNGVETKETPKEDTK